MIDEHEQYTRSRLYSTMSSSDLHEFVMRWYVLQAPTLYVPWARAIGDNVNLTCVLQQAAHRRERGSCHRDFRPGKSICQTLTTLVPLHPDCLGFSLLLVPQPAVPLSCRLTRLGPPTVTLSAPKPNFTLCDAECCNLARFSYPPALDNSVLAVLLTYFPLVVLLCPPGADRDGFRRARAHPVRREDPVQVHCRWHVGNR